MSIQGLLSSWRSQPSVGGNIEDWHALEARPPKLQPIPEALHPALGDSLGQAGIQSLYSHQASAWQESQDGHNIVVVTGTASGKTLCYNLPVLNRLLRNPQARALYLFPTKALAQDQMAGLKALTPDGSDLQAAIYDGDTPAGQRPGIRSRARLLFTNPDMLHLGILPHHTSWAEFFGNLAFVVIDEMHSYRGVFGSHFANVLRRLKRIGAFYGAFPQFILTSATIANPGELAGKLIEAPIHILDEDGSGRGAKTFLIYNPPVIDRELGLRRSALQESVRLAEDLLTYDIQSIIFARSRRSVELILTYLREKIGAFADMGSQTDNRVRGYRSGYLPSERREIELGLRQGQVRAVVATTALELGIDIGGMGAAILVGYPGNIAATWQQAGRAGRADEHALVVLVTSAAPLDQFLAANPEYLFERSPEHALINPDNLLILLDHLRCAAFELPFRDGERFGEMDPGLLAEFLEVLQQDGVLHRSGEKYYWMADSYPAQRISLRSASNTPVILQAWDGDRPITIGQVDQASAYWMVHPQAIYMHQGKTFLVEDFDLQANTVRLRPIETDYYTEPRRETSVELVEKFNQVEVAGGTKAHGEILVTSQVTGYNKVRWYTHERLGAGDLDLPPTQLLTSGYWLALSTATVEKLSEAGLWRDAPNNYGPNWESLRQQARTRDGFRCQVCGVPESGRAHDVHHKTPLRAFTSPEIANQLDNLITLCPGCHRRAETAVRIRSGLGGLAFALSHLAPFFLMCDVGDLGVHADPQSAVAGGEPAVVLYDQIPAGIGLCERLYEIHDEVLQRARQLVGTCKCHDGCPSCVGPGGENGQGGKRQALAILEALTEQP